MTLGSRICYFLGYRKFWVWASVLCFFSSFLNMSPFRASVLVFRILNFWSVHVCHCPSVEPVCLSLGLSVCFFLYSLPSCVHHVQFCSLCIIGPDLCQLCSQVCSLVWPFVYLMSASSSVGYRSLLHGMWAFGFLWALNEFRSCFVASLVPTNKAGVFKLSYESCIWVLPLPATCLLLDSNSQYHKLTSSYQF